MAGALKLVSMLLVCALVATQMTADAAITCGQVASSLAPCVPYLKNGGPLPAPCCSGVRTLNGVARSTPDRQAACQCLKTAAGSISGLKANLAAALPSACGVNIPYKISTSTNCKSVK
ncbi:unnamed protein product [Linum trigynum]|uniref:Non-specific lipid-transfer protein n=1 Tax=Linum trigynum TaxID=586398 RepID=A0AAV2DXZ0_9ROSI